jgi:hypothetical protein
MKWVCSILRYDLSIICLLNAYFTCTHTHLLHGPNLMEKSYRMTNNESHVILLYEMTIMTCILNVLNPSAIKKRGLTPYKF